MRQALVVGLEPSRRKTAGHGGCDFDLTGSRMRQSARQDDQRLVGMINGIINELSIDDRVVTWCAADNTTDRVVQHVGHRTAHRLGAIALAPSITRAASSTRGVSAIPQLPIRTTQTARPLSRTGH